MMSCAEVRPILSLLLEKETEPLETLETRRHLEDCGTCSSRTQRLARLMHAVDTLPQREPGKDLAPLVMDRLREMRESLWNESAVVQASKWSGLALILGAGLATMAGPGGPLLTSLGHRLAPFTGIVSRATDADGMREMLGGAVPVALRLLHGSPGSEVAAAGPDLGITIQILATALFLALALAIPVAATTFWLLHAGSRSRTS